MTVPIGLTVEIRKNKKYPLNYHSFYFLTALFVKKNTNIYPFKKYLRNVYFANVISPSSFQVYVHRLS